MDLIEIWEESSKWLDEKAKEVADFDLIPAPVKAMANDVVFNSVLPGNLQNEMTFDEDFFESSDLKFIKEQVEEREKETLSFRY